MPIKAENRALYPVDWKQISLSIRRDRAGNVCETAGCGAINGQPHPITGSRVVLTVAHLDHDPRHSDPSNLAALCQRCHFRYDQVHHMLNAAATRRGKLQTRDLFG